MNCSLCKYRSNLLGFEKEVALPQTSHHHHVEGAIQDCDLCEEECTGECESINSKEIDTDHVHHSHGHSHYPHANHPLGPVTLRRSNGSES